MDDLGQFFFFGRGEGAGGGVVRLIWDILDRGVVSQRGGGRGGGGWHNINNLQFSDPPKVVGISES